MSFGNCLSRLSIFRSKKDAFHFFGQAAAVRQALRSRTSQRLFPKRHLMASRALALAFDRRHAF